jgi:hypothetical protein
MNANEFTLAEIAVALQLPLERVITLRNLLVPVPLRRDAAGVAYYDAATLGRFRRLLIEHDATALVTTEEPQ